MIDLSKYLSAKSVIPDFKLNTKEEAVRALVDKIFEGNHRCAVPLTEQQVFDAVMERENMQTTGIGNGMAFPHARVDGWGDFALAMAISRGGIDFTSLDGKPANFIFLMVSSSDEPYIILQTMAAIIRFMGEMDFGSPILEGRMNVAEMFKRLKKLYVGAEKQILARDIARPATDVASLEMSLEEVTRMMHLNRVDVLPVVDENGKFCGEVSCLEIFEYGMPDFFKQLNTISFVRHIDPFERYFRIKKDLKVKDVFIKDAKPISKDMTLLEMIFEMSVRKRSKLFVAGEDGVLTGVIDRFSIIDKILFF